MKRKDARTGQRVTGAVRLFLFAVLLAGGSLAWVVLSTGRRGGVAGETPSLFLGGSALLAAVAGVNAVVAYGRLWWWYRCPQCGARLPRIQDKSLRLRYRCDKCHADWDTGWDDVPEGGD